MNKKALFFSLLLSGGVLLASAQEESSRTLIIDEVEYGQPNQTYNTYKTTWQKNRFKDNWIISLGAGGQMYIGEDDSKADFKNRITFAPSFSIGKYFSPIWGLKLNFTGGGLHGYNDGRAGTYKNWNKGNGYQGLKQASIDPVWAFNGWIEINGNDITIPEGSPIALEGDEYVWKPGDSGDLYMQRIHYAGASVNFMFDLLNLFGNYNPKRVFEITPFAGIGYYQRLENQGVDAGGYAGINGGMTFKFRLSERINFNLEGNAVYLPTAFDNHEGTSAGADGIVQATAGLSYKIGKTYWEVAEPTDYDLINRLNDEINRLREQANRPCPTCPPAPPCDPVEVPTEEIKFLPDPVFFRIDKSLIDPSEWSKIEKAVDYLNRNPEANVVVTGYADKETAYPEYNLKLSERRAKTVAQALTERYGINPLRVSINWAGDQIQPFKVNEWNRVVIFVIE